MKKFLFLLLCSAGLVFCQPAFAVQKLPSSDCLDAKIGQMILVGFRGLLVDEGSPIVRDIRSKTIGGVILFDYDVPSGSHVRNIQSPHQVKTMVKKLKSFSDVPLFVAIDQEGGKVSRLKSCYGFPDSVSASFLGHADNLDETSRTAEITAQTLKDLGINVNFAPVVDLNRNPENPVIGELERSYSPDSSVVIRHARATIDAFHRYGVLCAIKHFPGHGSSDSDSHEGFVDVTDSWAPEELLPFEALIRLKKADFVMTAHVMNRKLDPLWPATLSTHILSGILRINLVYTGVVISDDLQMGAIRLNYSLERAIYRAILAGCDMLVFANNSIYDEMIASRAHSIIRKLVLQKNLISPARINTSYKRIMALKSRLH
ncbi:MAG: glycoside hydrolase family 3 N-terminal domain-containing protein [Syntrophales bacterium]|nr:glycoside hydrolase family 3 N-terminal domain-containing protein [Syntrophales bacterium]